LLRTSAAGDSSSIRLMRACRSSKNANFSMSGIDAVRDAVRGWRGPDEEAGSV
jgi:hypothetical protein